MKKEDILHLEKLMNFLSLHFLKKNHWEDVTKTEWSYIGAELNDLIISDYSEKEIKKEPDLLGSNYLYEHLIINKLKKYQQNNNAVLSRPNLAKLSQIVKVLGYSNYIDFINSNTEAFNFNDLRIDMNNVKQNTALLDRLVGCWYSYNRNLPENLFRPGKSGYGALQWRSTSLKLRANILSKEAVAITINISEK
jgi:hypothetical protein